jgi:hypothetical protein
MIMQYKKKGFDPFSHSMDTMRLTAQTSISGMMIEDINVATGSHVDTGPAMNMVGMLPMIHGSKGVLMSLQDLNKSLKKK